MRLHHTARPRRRRGLALVLVVIHSVLILSVWGVANRQSVSLIHLKDWLDARETGALELRYRRLALGYALALLETGVPPESPYTCGAVVALPGEGMRSYRVEFTKDAGQPSIWSVSVALGDIAELDRPIRFGPPVEPPIDPPPEG